MPGTYTVFHRDDNPRGCGTLMSSPFFSKGPPSKKASPILNLQLLSRNALSSPSSHGMRLSIVPTGELLYSLGPES
jgi:hypothetical protein